MRFQINVSININQIPDDNERVDYGKSFHYMRTYILAGEKFSDIAPKIDAVEATIESFSESQPSAAGL